jgi:hypothetical protein
MDQISEIREAGVLIVRGGVPSEVLLHRMPQPSNYTPSFLGSSGLEAIVERLYLFKQ